ncbi:MAG TPA: RNA polymerase sigma factor [Actinomycetota bacterium]|nr:RNA polymerase sigma factor [Actinomycetota bacterium]
MPTELDALDTSTIQTLEDHMLAEQAGEDFAAFAELYRRYLCRIYRFVRAQTSDDATAEDLTAQVFFKALSSAGTFRGEGSYRSWLFSIARNTLATWRTADGRQVAVEAVPDQHDPSPTPAVVAIAQEERGLVWRAVATLPPAQREVIALRYIDDLSTEEIARITNRTRGAVRILLHRARNKLRHLFEGKDLL